MYKMFHKIWILLYFHDNFSLFRPIFNKANAKLFI